MKKQKKKRNLIVAVELTDLETGEQAIIPCRNTSVGKIKFIENIENFMFYKPLDENYVLPSKSKNSTLNLSEN